MSDTQSDYNKIINYLVNTPDLPDEVRSRIESWIIDHSDEPKLTESMANIWALLDSRQSPQRTKGLARLLKSVAAPPPVIKPTHYRAQRIWQAATAVASIAILLLCGYILQNNYQSHDIVLITARGSVGEFTLPDSTHVWLNGGTSLTYRQDFTSGSYRKVRVSGEAYFDVTHNPEHPFIVDMSAMEVEVLGTSFEVRNYADCRTHDVILRKGCVKVRGPWGNDDVTMRPDQIVKLDRKTNRLDIAETDAANYCRWFEQTTTFDNCPLIDILINISRRYGMDLAIDPEVDALMRMSVTMGNESLENIMYTLTYLSPIAYNTDNNCLHIKSAAH